MLDNSKKTLIYLHTYSYLYVLHYLVLWFLYLRTQV